jgi:hypothetical protein
MFPVFASTMLAIESHRVITLRLAMMAGGGAGVWDEAQLMVGEKVDAAVEATISLLTGHSPGVVVDRYRERVATNVERLTARA